MNSFFQNHIGEFSSLLTAICWTITSLAFESAGKRVGSLSVNIIRLLMAFIFLGIISLVRNDTFIPLDADYNTWGWLLLSGLIGFVIGDLLLFQAFVEIGARISMLMMSLAPPLAALFGWIIIGEQLGFYHIIGMVITLSGIAIVIISKPTEQSKMKLSYPLRGLLLAFGGATGQGLGLVISKLGMKDYDPFLSTQIRVIAGIGGFGILFSFYGYWSNFKNAIKNTSALKRISLGAFFGPFLGVSLSLLAIQHTSTGVASTIMAIVPVLIIAPAAIIFKEKITLKEVLGAIIAIGGVITLFVS